MSTAREAILGALEAARPPVVPRPPAIPHPAMPDAPLSRLRTQVEAAGGRLQHVHGADWTTQVEWAVDLEQAQHVASSVTEVAERGVGIGTSSPEELAKLDLCVLRGHFAVVENGAVWHVPASATERAAALLAEHLVLVVAADALVATLHQAYQQIDLGEIGFGWFLCGPSKTADIEQSLVLGAHGPRTMHLVLLER